MGVDRVDADAVEEAEADLDCGQVEEVDSAVLEVGCTWGGLVPLALDEGRKDRAAGEPGPFQLRECLAAGEQGADAGRPAEHLVEGERGAYFAFALLWRGVGYGVVDTLLLTILPCFVAYKVLHGHVAGLKGKLRFTALALPLVIVVTATYHWGYPQYRQDGLSRPETGNVLISIPTFATVNPVGSVFAHVSQHIAAVTHAYESRIFNPPVTKS